MFSELNTRPGCTSVNASPRRLPDDTHHSRPRRLARSYLVRLFHSLPFSGFRRRTLTPLLRRLLAVLRLVFRGELGFELRIAEEALRLRPVVLLAPVALLSGTRPRPWRCTARRCPPARHVRRTSCATRRRIGGRCRRFGRLRPLRRAAAATADCQCRHRQHENKTRSHPVDNIIQFLLQATACVSYAETGSGTRRESVSA